MKATVVVVFSTYAEMEPPEMGTVSVSPTTCGVQARPEERAIEG